MDERKGSLMCSERDQTAREKDKYEQMWNFPGYRTNHSSAQQVDKFISMVAMPVASSVLDIGCGAGYAARRFAEVGMKPLCIDIASNSLNEENRDLPFLRCTIWQIPVNIEADFGYCTDVMEHIPPDQINRTFAAIRRAVKNEIFFGIALREDTSGKLIGQTLHLTVNPASWWMEKLQQHWADVSLLGEAANQYAIFLARPFAKAQ